jgi:hypothetical protein
MAQLNSNTIAAELEKVDATVPMLFDRKVTFYAEIEKGDVEVISNRAMRVPLEMNPGGYFGMYNPDGGGLGRGAGYNYDYGSINAVHLRYAVEWTKKAEWGANSSAKSVIDVFKKNMANAMPEFRRGFDALCSTDGTGVLATVASHSTGGGVDTYVLDSEYGAKLLRFGQKVNVFSGDLQVRRTAAGSEVEITYLDLNSNTIKVPAVASSQAGDKIVIEGVTESSDPTSLLGVRYHHNSSQVGQWLGFDRSTTPEVRANSVDANGSALTLPFARLAINKMLNRVEQDGKGPLELFAMLHPCQAQAYEQLGQLVSRIDKAAKEEPLNLYFNRSMQLAGAPTKESFMWSKKIIDFIHKSYWKRAEIMKPGFYTVDGRKIFEARDSAGGVATSQMFYLVAGWNLYISNPAAGTFIENLKIPSGY